MPMRRCRRRRRRERAARFSRVRNWWWQQASKENAMIHGTGFWGEFPLQCWVWLPGIEPVVGDRYLPASASVGPPVTR